MSFHFIWASSNNIKFHSEWNSGLCFVFFNHSKCFSQSVVQQWEEAENNTPRKIRTSTFANELPASQCTEACRYYWHAEVQTKRLNGGGRKMFVENFPNCWFARNVTHYHVCSVQKMVQYHSRNKWKPRESLRTPCSVGENDLSTAGARGECANWSRWSQITWISNLNGAIYFSAFMLFVRRHLPCFKCSTLSSHQTVSSRFWLMAVSLSTKLQTMLVISNSFFQVQFYSLLESGKRRTKDLMVKVSHVNYCNSLPPLLTPNPKLTAAAVKRAVWMINKDH